MATGAPDSNGIWIYGEDDSEATFSALLNKLGNSASSALTTKLNALPGKIIKIANTSTATQVNSASSTPVSTGLSIAYTPISSTSRIIIFYTVNGVAKSAGNNNTAAQIYLRKDATAVITHGVSTMYGLPAHVGMSVGGTYTEISGSTSARTYAVFFNQLYDGGTVNVQRDAAASTMTIIEVSQ